MKLAQGRREIEARQNQTKAAAREGGRIENSQTENPKMQPSKSNRSSTNPDQQHQFATIRTTATGERGNRTKSNAINPDFCRNQTKIELESINYKKFETQSQIT